MRREDAIDCNAGVFSAEPQITEVGIGQVIELEERTKLEPRYRLLSHESEEPRKRVAAFDGVGLHAHMQAQLALGSGRGWAVDRHEHSMAIVACPLVLRPASRAGGMRRPSRPRRASETST